MNKDIKNTKQQNLRTANIVIEEVKTQLFDIINNSGLPSSIQELIAKDFYIQIREAFIQIYQIEKARYDESLKEPD